MISISRKKSRDQNFEKPLFQKNFSMKLESRIKVGEHEKI